MVRFFDKFLLANYNLLDSIFSVKNCRRPQHQFLQFPTVTLHLRFVSQLRTIVSLVSKNRLKLVVYMKYVLISTSVHWENVA